MLFSRAWDRGLRKERWEGIVVRDGEVVRMIVGGCIVVRIAEGMVAAELVGFQGIGMELPVVALVVEGLVMVGDLGRFVVVENIDLEPPMEVVGLAVEVEEEGNLRARDTQDSVDLVDVDMVKLGLVRR